MSEDRSIVGRVSQRLAEECGSADCVHVDIFKIEACKDLDDGLPVLRKEAEGTDEYYRPVSPDCNAWQASPIFMALRHTHTLQRVYYSGSQIDEARKAVRRLRSRPYSSGVRT